MPLTICYAGAGAGKTYALVCRYLYHALQERGGLERVLAITFTNKAKDEMKERIMRCLYALSRGDKTSFTVRLKEMLNYDDITLQACAKDALHDALNNHELLSVSTIDAFFQKVVNFFSDELGLGCGYEILLNERRLLDEAMTVLWQGLNKDPVLEKAFVNFSLQRMAAGKTWDGSPAIQSIAASALFNRAHCLKENFEGAYGARATLLQKITKKKGEHEQKLTGFAQKMWNTIEQAGLGEKDFLWGSGGIWGFLNKMKHSITTPKVRVRRAATDVNYWLKNKSSPFKSVIEHFLQSCLQELLDYYDHHYGYYATAVALQPLQCAFMATYRLGAIVEKSIRDEGRVPIGRLPLLVGQLLTKFSVKDIYARMGMVYDVIMVDEFQDVSTLQWSLIKPFLLHGLAKGGHGFFVGDVKQSIYGWRGGNPHLLLSKVAEEVGPEAIKKEFLQCNYRSAPHIVRFNNAFFSVAPFFARNLLYSKMKERCEDVDRWEGSLQIVEDMYAHVGQKLPQSATSHYKGYVEVCFSKSEKNEGKKGWQSIGIAYALHTVRKLIKKGYKLKDIVLLVRDNREAGLLSEAFFADGNGKDASWNIKTVMRSALGEDPYIQLLVQALKYIHEGEDWSLAMLVHFYRRYIVLDEEELYWDAFCGSKNLSDYLPAGFDACVSGWRRMPLYALVCDLITFFGLKKVEGSSLQVLQEVVHGFRLGGHLGEFLDWWDKEGSECVLSEGDSGDLLRIMTVHQAKGLDFEVVLVPFCDWRLDHPGYSAPVLWASSEVPPFTELGFVPLRYGRHLADTVYDKAYYEELQRIYLEGLHLLYVALTRAKKELYVFVPGSASGVGSLVREALQGHLVNVGEKCEIIEEEKVEKWCLGEQGGKKGGECDRRVSLLSSFSNTLSHHSTLLHEADDILVLKGKWWDRFLSLIVTKEDIGRVVDSYVAKGAMSVLEGKEVLQKTKAWWTHARMDDWFSAGWEVWCERRFLLPDGSSLRPDRVMLRSDEAVVLDFKTGEEREKDYIQVYSYVKVLQKMGTKQVSGYLFFIEDNRLVRVV